MDLMAQKQAEWRWGLVGNIIGEHEFGENRDIYYGTKHFSSGTKVYCAPAQWGDGYENIVVIGKPRHSFKYIEIVMSSNMIENFRLQKVYKPAVLKKMADENSWGFWGNTDEDKAAILDMRLQSEGFGLVSKECVWLSFATDSFLFGKIKFYSWADLENPDVFNEVQLSLKK
ncbi:MAG: hypothetical protein K6G18_04670 [Treponema sp.]|nr:hypothetical protein [Treponema sp.]